MPINLSTLDSSQIQDHLKNHSLKIGVVGIGRIGLPTALCFANAGFETIGIDINEKLVNMVNSGDYPLKDEPEFDKIFENVIESKKFRAETNIEKVVPDCDIAKTTSFLDKEFADISCICGSEINEEEIFNLKNLCCASIATGADPPKA